MAPPVGFEKGALEGKSSPEDRRPTGQRSNSLRRSIHAATVMPLECVEKRTSLLPKKVHVFLGVKGGRQEAVGRHVGYSTAATA
jgi:hypothetical protein